MFKLTPFISTECAFRVYWLAPERYKNLPRLFRYFTPRNSAALFCVHFVSNCKCLIAMSDWNTPRHLPSRWLQNFYNCTSVCHIPTRETVSLVSNVVFFTVSFHCFCIVSLLFNDIQDVGSFKIYIYLQAIYTLFIPAVGNLFLCWETTCI